MGLKVESVAINSSADRLKKKWLGVIAAASWRTKVTKKLQIQYKVTISACGSLNTRPLMISTGLVCYEDIICTNKIIN